MKRVLVIALLAFSLGRSQAASAQSAHASTSGHSLEVGGQITSARIGELDTDDVGFGGRLSWFPTPFLGVEGELNFFGADIPDRVAITAGRMEALFGVTAGPRMTWWRPFARARAGVLRLDPAPQPIACALIFPPALPCALAGGDSLLTVDVGGGLEVFTPARTFVRVDIGDRMLSTPGLPGIAPAPSTTAPSSITICARPSGAAGDSEMSEGAEEWRCPTCGSGSEEHTVERDGPESLEVVVCRRCGSKWPPRQEKMPVRHDAARNL